MNSLKNYPNEFGSSSQNCQNYNYLSMDKKIKKYLIIYTFKILYTFLYVILDIFFMAVSTLLMASFIGVSWLSLFIGVVLFLFFQEFYRFSQRVDLILNQ